MSTSSMVGACMTDREAVKNDERKWFKQDTTVSYLRTKVSGRNHLNLFFIGTHWFLQ
jgi:hypothetical protein